MARARMIVPALFCVTFIRLTSTIPVETTRTRSFPKDFYFGVSTAAYQIEGAWNTSDKGESIWDRVSHTTPSPIANSDNGDVSCDSYHLYERDIEMLQELGVDYYRFSISWSRLLPTGFPNTISQDGLDYYNRLIDALLAKKITPMVTLYHWDLPQALQDLGGWPNVLIADYFEDYARVVFESFGDRVKTWVTFNEPKQVCLEGYGQATMAPLVEMSGVGDYMCANTLLLAHARAFRLYEESFMKTQGGKVGITLDVYWAEPITDSKEDFDASDRFLQFTLGLYAHPIFSSTGDYPPVMKKRVEANSYKQGFPRSRLPELSSSDVKMIRGSAHFLGLNHYSTKMVRSPTPGVNSSVKSPSFDDDIGVVTSTDPSWPGSASSWLKVVPWGFRKVLNWIRKEYSNPAVIITENGYSTGLGLQDKERVYYLQRYLGALLDAIDDGCNIRAYTAWSLMDNFEWMKGFTERFGLYEVDFSSPNRTRIPRASAVIYSEIIRTRSVQIMEPCADCSDEVSVPQIYNTIVI